MLIYLKKKPYPNPSIKEKSVVVHGAVGSSFHDGRVRKHSTLFLEMSLVFVDSQRADVKKENSIFECLLKVHNV